MQTRQAAPIKEGNERSVFVSLRVPVRQEQERAAKWATVEQVKELEGRRAVLAVRAQNWGYSLANISKALMTNGESIIYLNLKDFPDKSEVIETKQELEELFPRLKSQKESLAAMGY